MADRDTPAKRNSFLCVTCGNISPTFHLKEGICRPCRREITYRTCRTCKSTQPVTQFQGRRKTCNQCTNYRTCRKCNDTQPVSHFQGRSETCNLCTNNRTCRKCNITQSVTEFQGRRITCKLCTNNRTCNRCNVTQPITEFRGRNRICIQCTSVQTCLRCRQVRPVDEFLGKRLCETCRLARKCTRCHQVFPLSCFNEQCRICQQCQQGNSLLPTYFHASTAANARQHHLGLMDTTCTHCFARFFKHENYTGCCLNGKVKLPPLPSSLPPVLGSFMTQPSFRRHIVSYNAACAFVSVGCKQRHFSNNANAAPPTFVVQGGVYHVIGNAARTNQPAFMQMYIYDVAASLATWHGVHQHIFNDLFAELKEYNPYAQALKTWGAQGNTYIILYHVSKLRFYVYIWRAQRNAYIVICFIFD